MLQDWEAGYLGNNPGIVSVLPRAVSPARVVINLVRGRRSPRRALAELHTAA